MLLLLRLETDSLWSQKHNPVGLKATQEVENKRMRLWPRLSFFPPWCCGKTLDTEPSLNHLLTIQLSLIEDYYPGTDVVCLMNTDGKLIAYHGKDDALRLSSEKVCPTMSQMRRAALQFAAVLEVGCSVMHVRGEHLLFSCYEIDEHIILAFYSPLAGQEPPFDVREADKGLRKVIAELKELAGSHLLSPPITSAGTRLM